MKTSVRQAAENLSLRTQGRKMHIEHDIYGIADRLREIEDGYFVMFDRFSGKYEVHSSLNKMNTLCFIVPYDCLDARTLAYCEETRQCHKDELIRRMEENNRRIDEERLSSFRNNMTDISIETSKELSLALDKDSTNKNYKRTHGGIAV